MIEQATLTLEEEITTLRSQLSAQEKELRDTQRILDSLTQAPYFRAKHVRSLEEQLKKKKIAHEILYEQSVMYTGTDLQGQFDREVKESSQRLKEYEHSIHKTRKEDSAQDKADGLEMQEYRQAEQKLLQQITTRKNKLKELEKKYKAKHANDGEQAYKECEQKYSEVLQSVVDKQELQEQALAQLAEWPDLQERFLQEHKLQELPEPVNGMARIARAAIAYLDALIEDGAELSDMLIQDGMSVSELLSLSEQEVLAHGYSGGIDLLQQKRATLLRFV